MRPQPNPYIHTLQPYEPGLSLQQVATQYTLAPKEIIKLASNENPLGPSPRVREAVASATADIHRYPEQSTLIKELADFHNVATEMIVLGNGSNDILELVAHVYLNAGDEAVSSQYSFSMYQLATQATGARNSIVPAMHYGHDLEAMLHAITLATKVVWLVNPNNPTGTLLPYAKVHEFLTRIPSKIIVVLDEAYYEYLMPEEKVDTIQWLKEFPNLILVRTFSKIYGLAGLRIGYGIASPEVTGLLHRARQPFNTNHMALIAAQAALSDVEFVSRSYQANLAARTQILAGLKQLRLECLPAHGNFITFKTIPITYKLLLRQGIIVRPLSDYAMPEWLRVTAGLPSENERLLAALKKQISSTLSKDG